MPQFIWSPTTLSKHQHFCVHLYFPSISRKRDDSIYPTVDLLLPTFFPCNCMNFRNFPYLTLPSTFMSPALPKFRCSAQMPPTLHASCFLQTHHIEQLHAKTYMHICMCLTLMGSSLLSYHALHLSFLLHNALEKVCVQQF